MFQVLILVMARLASMLFEAVVICAMVANGGYIFYRCGSQDQKDEADAKKLKFCEPDSDFMTVLNVYKVALMFYLFHNYVLLTRDFDIRIG